jgi:hypothetical protein
LLNETAQSPPNTLPYETLPGGNVNPHDNAACSPDINYYVPFLFRIFQQTSLYNGNICFVPSYSALDVQTVTSATAYAKYVNGGTSNPSPPRVASYIAQEQTGSSATQYNLPHLRFTARNSEWIYNQMENLPLASNFCTRECSALTVTGPEQVCVSGATFQASSANVIWTASPSHLFTTTSGTGSQFTTAAAAGVRGTGTITATITGTCDVVTLPVRVGEYISGTYQASASNQAGPLAEDDVVELYSNTVNIHLPYLPNTTYSFSAHSTDPAYAYQFYAYSAADATLQFTTTTPGFYMVWVTITKTSPCGTTTAEYGFAYNYSQGYGYRYATYPNPADDNLTVEQTTNTSNAQRSPAARGAKASSASSAAPSTPYTVRLFDSYGVQQVQQATTTSALQLSTRKLPTGLYLLHIEVNGEVIERRRLQITH